MGVLMTHDGGLAPTALLAIGAALRRKGETSLEAMTHRLIEVAMDVTHGNQREAARLLYCKATTVNWYAAKLRLRPTDLGQRAPHVSRRRRLRVVR